MKDEEPMDDMFGRLEVLLNNLEALGQTYSKAQINLKVLENFPKVSKPKTTTIQEARDLKNLAWDELSGILTVMKSIFKIGSICKRRILLPSSLKRQASKKKKRKACPNL